MLDRIPETDWKLFRKLRELALERFCDRILREVGSLASDSAKTSHERYLQVYRFIDQSDEDVARLFNDARRSQALMQLALMCSHKLLTPAEIAGFTVATRDRLAVIAELCGEPPHTRKEK